MSRGWHWLLNRQTGLIPRMRLAAGVLGSALQGRGHWRVLPYDFATALLAPIRVPGPPAPPIAARDWSPERAAAAARLRRAAERWAVERQASESRVGEGAAPLSFAVIADADDVVRWDRSGSVVELRPEDWAVLLERAEAAGALPAALLVTSTIEGNHGAWAYRLGPFAHPDAFLQRDVAALVAWFAGRDLPSIFLATDDGAGTVRGWGDVARLFDLVLAPNEDTAAGFSARADRQGIEANVIRGHAGLADIWAAVAALA